MVKPKDFSTHVHIATREHTGKCSDCVAGTWQLGNIWAKCWCRFDCKVVVPVPRLMEAYPRYFCNPSYSYIIAGTGQSYTFLPNCKEAHKCSLSHCDVLDVRMLVKCRLHSCGMSKDKLTMNGYLLGSSFCWKGLQKGGVCNLLGQINIPEKNYISHHCNEKGFEICAIQLATKPSHVIILL
jgi:hypothetical protein